MAFVHLHAHSYYSLLDGCASPAHLAQAASRAGMQALALTDHDALYGAIEFYDACQHDGVQPVLGMELTLDAGRDGPDALVLLAQDLSGYASLCRLSSALQTQPDREAALARGLSLDELEGRHQGLIALSGGKRGRIDRLIRSGRPREAEAAAAEYAERFGQHAFYVEMQIQAPGDLEAARSAASLARRLGLGTVAANNVHYTAPEEALRCRLLNAMGKLQSLDETPPRPGLHLASVKEMEATFAEFPEAVSNTAAIAGRCRFELPLGRPVFPEIGLPGGRSTGEALRAQAIAGAERRYGSLTETVRSRLDRELAVIDGMGYASLFLIVADVVRYAHEQGVPVNLRGSAASSVVAYCLGISAVDPIALDLYFERFLNPERRDPPDIDLDLCSRRRDEVIRYIYHRFGADRVATICTYSRVRARSAWREVAKAYRLPQARVEVVAREVPPFWHPGMGAEIERAKERILAAAASDREREALAEAWALDGYPHHLSVHPGGMVIAPGPLTDRVPLQWATKGVVITQYDLHGIERLGLVKFDMLGIRALTVVAESVELVQRCDPAFARESIADGDGPAGDLLERADSIGCFQTESPGMRRTLRELGARTIEDVTVALALFKPGPLQGGLKDAFVRRHRGQEPSRYLHPALEPILHSTHGVVLYQEQVLRIAHELAGFSLGEADRMRRGIAHLGRGSELLPLREGFIRQAGEVSGMSPDVAARLWELMESFAGYGFLKAHAASYAAVAYQTAYLKAHHPAEFMTGLLRNWGGYYPQQIYLEEARRLGLELHPPHVNHSRRRFDLERGPDGRPVLWMGLGQVRELTRRTTAAILEARREGSFASLDALLQRARPRTLEAENLVKAGALDGLGGGRRAMLDELRGRLPGAPLQLALPLAWGQEAPGGDFTPVEHLAQEMEMLGWPVSAHPLAPFAREIAERGVVRSDTLVQHAGERVTVAGARLSLWGERRGQVTFGDEAGFFALHLPAGHRLRPGSLGKLGPYLASGRVQVDRSGETAVQAETVEPL
jgi:DNA-directed DNA polymerase III PolC